jgi:hypothetical protein
MPFAITYNAPETCEAIQDSDVVRNVLLVLNSYGANIDQT